MKYKIEIGGFVETFNKQEDCFVERFRHRSLIIHAKNENEAKEKAVYKFIDLCQKKVGNMCDDCVIDSIIQLQK